MGKGFYLGNIHISFYINAFGFFRKDNRHIKVSGSHTGDTDTGGLDGQDFIDGLVCKAAFPLGSHLVKESNVHLVIEKAVNLQDVSFLYNTVLHNTFF